jgi:hypothetical protein
MNTKHAEQIANFKSDIKLVATFTKQLNKLFKEYNRTDDYTDIENYLNSWKESKKIPSIVNAWTYNRKYFSRHMHVAYSLLKGNTLEQIEGNSRTELNHSLVKKYIVEYTGSDELADSIDLNDPRAKIGGMFQTVMNLIKGGK